MPEIQNHSSDFRIIKCEVCGKHLELFSEESQSVKELVPENTFDLVCNGCYLIIGNAFEQYINETKKLVLDYIHAMIKQKEEK